MFPEELADVHSSSSVSSSSSSPSLSSIKFNSIAIPNQSPLLSSAESFNAEEQKLNILAITTTTTTESAQATVDIVIDIPALSTARTTKKAVISKSIQSIPYPSSATEGSTKQVSSQTITIDRIDENENEKQFKKFNTTDHYKCIPPPLFVILVSIIEVTVFLYESWIVKHQENYKNEDGIAIPSDSIFVYRPDRRQQIWRFFSYMVLHVNWFHLSFNIIVQLMFGIPLEIIHGSFRIGCIYLAGVFAGSLGTSVVDSKVYLVGASGGVYALLGSHLANILLNYKQIKYVAIKLLSIVIFGLCDIGFAIYTHYLQNINLIVDYNFIDNNNNNDNISNDDNSMLPISYVAHLSGALAGLTIGLLVLKNFELTGNQNSNEKIKTYRHLLWWTALGIYMAFIIFTVTFNIMNTMTAQILEEKGQVIKQYLLHNLGSS